MHASCSAWYANGRPVPVGCAQTVLCMTTSSTGPAQLQTPQGLHDMLPADFGHSLWSISHAGFDLRFMCNALHLHEAPWWCILKAVVMTWTAVHEAITAGATCKQRMPLAKLPKHVTLAFVAEADLSFITLNHTICTTKIVNTFDLTLLTRISRIRAANTIKAGEHNHSHF